MAETIEATILRLRAERLTQAAIAERLGLPQPMISKILRDAGVRGSWTRTRPGRASLAS
ncbi:helix-turn-helix domain-containing protein [Methylobacterium sp. J-067]|uniref:helix-turn-helix domain-containing protein n=1 Tax=Methylobacterium sp. J-067 TaxID=2836648 RepID=UPI001FB9E6DF|nr:helix-turn-helix domain-containing protein [Methylobacterium sp. J-067]MCJ2025585.1 helix-turn-helix domain-containing protein [Methylobacterium sp. J-067]